MCDVKPIKKQNQNCEFKQIQFNFFFSGKKSAAFFFCKLETQKKTSVSLNLLNLPPATTSLNSVVRKNHTYLEKRKNVIIIHIFSQIDAFQYVLDLSNMFRHFIR